MVSFVRFPFCFFLGRFLGSHVLTRETSNKALNAINAIHLIPFLVSFLAARDKLPIAPIVSAGT